jgi:hypothetical protein
LVVEPEPARVFPLSWEEAWRVERALRAVPVAARKALAAKPEQMVVRRVE